MKRRKITLANETKGKTLKTRIVTDENGKSLFAIHRTWFTSIVDLSSYTVTHVPTGYAICKDLEKDVAMAVLETLVNEKTLNWNFTDPKDATKTHGTFVRNAIDEAKGIIEYRTVNNLR